MKNNKSYVMEFETKGRCCVWVYEYEEKSRLFRDHRGDLIFWGYVNGIPIGNGYHIEDITGLTTYGFKKYLPQLIDAVFENALLQMVMR